MVRTYIVLHCKLQYLAKGILTADGVSLEVTDVIVCREYNPDGAERL